MTIPESFSLFLKKQYSQFLPLQTIPSESNKNFSQNTFVRFELLYSLGCDPNPFVYLINPQFFASYKNTFAFDASDTSGAPSRLFHASKKPKNKQWLMGSQSSTVFEELYAEPFDSDSRELLYPKGYTMALRVVTPGFSETLHFLEPDWVRIITPGALIDGYIKNSLGRARQSFTMVYRYPSDQWLVRFY